MKNDLPTTKEGSSSSLLWHRPGNREVPWPGWGFLLLLFPWARNFIPIASATQLLNWDTYVVFTSEHS